MQTNDPHRYDDMLDLPHHVSETKPLMSMLDRAAQFSPFAALTGYHAAIDESGRYTEGFHEPDEIRREQIGEALALLQSALDAKPVVQITFFVPDDRKDGGQWQTVTDAVESMDDKRQVLRLANGREIAFLHILEIRTELF